MMRPTSPSSLGALVFAGAKVFCDIRRRARTPRLGRETTTLETKTIMTSPRKSTVEEIRQRFDAEVERFSNLETGQSATIDAPLVLSLISEAAARVTPAAQRVLDLGCGAGNYSLKLLERLPGRDMTLVDLSRNMLDRATQRVSAATTGSVEAIQSDIRELPWDQWAGRFDVVMAAATLHHLRTDAEWQGVFAGVHRCLRPGGAFWVADLIAHDDPAVQAMMWRRYGEYLEEMGGEGYREKVFTYVEAEDTPRSATFQLELLRTVGFGSVEILHKVSCFAAFGGLKRG
jgi:tRNA (cmo5U34)-methyltransferase